MANSSPVFSTRDNDALVDLGQQLSELEAKGIIPSSQIPVYTEHSLEILERTEGLIDVDPRYCTSAGIDLLTNAADLRFNASFFALQLGVAEETANYHTMLGFTELQPGRIAYGQRMQADVVRKQGRFAESYQRYRAVIDKCERIGSDPASVRARITELCEELEFTARENLRQFVDAHPELRATDLPAFLALTSDITLLRELSRVGPADALTRDCIAYLKVVPTDAPVEMMNQFTGFLEHLYHSDADAWAAVMQPFAEAVLTQVHHSALGSVQVARNQDFWIAVAMISDATTVGRSFSEMAEVATIGSSIMQSAGDVGLSTQLKIDAGQWHKAGEEFQQMFSAFSQARQQAEAHRMPGPFWKATYFIATSYELADAYYDAAQSIVDATATCPRASLTDRTSLYWYASCQELMGNYQTMAGNPAQASNSYREAAELYEATGKPKEAAELRSKF